jgi:ribulose-5-phosphate 4-epimerase/fuculose-1-phosphate aldolase
MQESTFQGLEIRMASTLQTLSTSEVPAGMPAAEWQVRCDLAAAYQLIDLYDMSDTGSTHISARVPGDEDHFLLNPRGTLFDQITASCLIKVDLEGRVVEGEANDLNFVGFVIHSAIHRAKPNLVCALHTHTVANNGVAAMEEGLLPLTQKAMLTLPFVRYHDYEGASTEFSERDRLVRDLGDGRALLLRNHGALSVGESISEAWGWMYRLEMSCRMQVAVMSCAGGNLTPIKLREETIQHTMDQGREFFSAGGPFAVGATGWDSLLRKLERERGFSYCT